MANTPKLRVNGREISYWVSAQIDRSIDSLADTFTLQYNRHSQLPKGEANPLTFDGDEEAELTIDGEVMLTGYIDSASVSASAKGDSVSLSGYSRTADLVQCPVLPRSKSYKDQSIEAICADLCKPYGIDVVVDESASEAAATKLERFKSSYGETVQNAMGRATRYEGLLLFSSADGGLRLSRASGDRVKTVLEHGRNIEAVKISRDARDRFSHYYVLSDGASGFDPDDGDKDDGRVALVKDLGVARYRPTIIATEQDVKTQTQRRAQAEWERNRRAGLSLQVSVQFPSWHHSEGIWEPNTLVRFRSARYKLDLDMLISTVSFSRDPQTAAVQLELSHPSAFEPRKVPLPRRRKARAKLTDVEFVDAPDIDHFEDTPYGELYAEDGPWEGDIEYEDGESEPF